jgi:hypothetical protein
LHGTTHIFELLLRCRFTPRRIGDAAIGATGFKDVMAEEKAAANFTWC